MPCGFLGIQIICLLSAQNIWWWDNFFKLHSLLTLFRHWRLNSTTLLSFAVCVGLVRLIWPLSHDLLFEYLFVKFMQRTRLFALFCLQRTRWLLMNFGIKVVCSQGNGMLANNSWAFMNCSWTLNKGVSQIEFQKSKNFTILHFLHYHLTEQQNMISTIPRKTVFYKGRCRHYHSKKWDVLWRHWT